MPIDFDEKRWKKIKADSRLWWAGKLKRPLIRMTVWGLDSGRPKPELPKYNFTSFYDLSVPAEAIVDRWDYDLSTRKFLGDAFPSVWPNFGAGVIAAFLGAKLENSIETGTTWFHPQEDKKIADIHFEYDPDNVWLKRVKAVCRAAMERWGGLVQVSMTDLGGNLDILSAFRPGERLLLDLYDHPEEVKRLTWEAHEIWWRYFEEINAILQPGNHGHTAWTPIFSEEPYYMLQCDFCYMLGPDMFDEFVRPELAASCKRLGNPFYHLDGPGQLPHLDSLLKIKELKGVQWIPGDRWAPANARSEYYEPWGDIYRKIHEAGKLIQIFGGRRELETVAGHIGTAAGIVCIGGAKLDEMHKVKKFLTEYGAL